MRLRQFWVLALASVFAIAGTACTAELEEGCLGGECTSSGSSSSSSSGGSSCETTPTVGDFPCDVFTVLQNNCQSCHQDPPKVGAPYPLLTFEDTRELHGMTMTPRWRRMGQVVESNFMPIGMTMSAEDKQTLLDWVDACAPPAEGMGCE